MARTFECRVLPLERAAGLGSGLRYSAVVRFLGFVFIWSVGLPMMDRLSPFSSFDSRGMVNIAMLKALANYPTDLYETLTAPLAPAARKTRKSKPAP